MLSSIAMCSMHAAIAFLRVGEPASTPIHSLIAKRRALHAYNRQLLNVHQRTRRSCQVRRHASCKSIADFARGRRFATTDQSVELLRVRPGAWTGKLASSVAEGDCRLQAVDGTHFAIARFGFPGQLWPATVAVAIAGDFFGFRWMQCYRAGLEATVYSMGADVSRAVTSQTGHSNE